MLFTIPALGLLGYLIGRYAKDIEAAPRGLFLALDHATFIGILTNAILGLVLIATAERPTLWARANAVVFWGNLGLATAAMRIRAEIPPPDGDVSADRELRSEI
jgi:hypothetical protein